MEDMASFTFQNGPRNYKNVEYLLWNEKVWIVFGHINFSFFIQFCKLCGSKDHSVARRQEHARLKQNI